MKNTHINTVLGITLLFVLAALVVGGIWVVRSGLLYDIEKGEDALQEEENEEVAPEEEDVTLRVYFTTDQTGVVTCEATDYVERSVPATQAVGQAAIEELLKGPTTAEQEQGFTTSINAGTQLQSLRVEDGIAYADFNETLDENIGGSCLVSAIYSQIANTLEQFDTVDNTVISINGETEEVLQP